MTVLAPMLAIVAWMAAFEPSPISIMAITALTPMITPSAVKAERNLFRRKACSAVWRVRGSSAAGNRRRGDGKLEQSRVRARENCFPVALQSNLDKSARSKLDRSGSWEMEDYERERTMFGRAMEEGEVAV